MPQSSPQVIITLTDEGHLVAELPGANGARRKLDLKQGAPNKVKTVLSLLDEAHVEVGSKTRNDENLYGILDKLRGLFEAGYDESLIATLTRILQAQKHNRTIFGEDGAPSQAQVRHWEKHVFEYDPKTGKENIRFPDMSCAFCANAVRLSYKSKPLSRADKLSLDIRALNAKGAADWEYRKLLSIRQKPLRAKTRDLAAETWRERAIALRDEWLKPKTPIELASHGTGANAVKINLLPPRKGPSAPKPKQVKLMPDLSLL